MVLGFAVQGCCLFFITEQTRSIHATLRRWTAEVGRLFSYEGEHIVLRMWF